MFWYRPLTVPLLILGKPQIVNSSLMLTGMFIFLVIGKHIIHSLFDKNLIYVAGQQLDAILIQHLLPNYIASPVGLLQNILSTQDN